MIDTNVILEQDREDFGGNGSTVPVEIGSLRC